MFYKMWKLGQEKRNHKEITKSLGNISEILQKMDNKLDGMRHIMRKTSIHRRTK